MAPNGNINQKNSALSALSAVKTCPAPRHSRRSGNPEPFVPHPVLVATGIQNPSPPRHSRRNGNPEPFVPPPVILAAAGIQSPFPHPVSSQRESRTLSC